MNKRRVDPYRFIPTSNEEYAAHEAWKAIESHHPHSFNFYLWAISKGVPASKFFQFTSEIVQDPTIKKRGAIFVTKVKDYLSKMH